MGPLLLSFAFITIAAGVITGFLKLVRPNNQALRVLHRACGPLANFLFALYFILFQFFDSGPNQRVILAAAFMLLVYAGIVSAKPELTPKGKYAHIALAVLSLVLFTFLFVTEVLIRTGAVSSIGG